MKTSPALLTMVGVIAFALVQAALTRPAQAEADEHSRSQDASGP